LGERRLTSCRSDATIMDLQKCKVNKNRLVFEKLFLATISERLQNVCLKSCSPFRSWANVVLQRIMQCFQRRLGAPEPIRRKPVQSLNLVLWNDPQTFVDGLVFGWQPQRGAGGRQGSAPGRLVSDLRDAVAVELQMKDEARPLVRRAAFARS